MIIPLIVSKNKIKINLGIMEEKKLIKSIILSEFNDIQGPVIVSQYPEKYFPDF